METERHFHWTALVISGLTAVFLWCIACSFYSKAVNLCPGVEVKWENGGVSPAALVKQQTFARQDGAAEQPEVTLWQAASGYEVMSGDRKSMAADMVMVFGDCRADVYKRQILCCKLLRYSRYRDRYLKAPD